MFCWTVRLKGIKGCRHAAVTVGHMVYCFAGASDEDSDQIGVHVFNTVPLLWTTLPQETPGRERHLEVPSRRWGHTAVLIEETVYVWGGRPYCNMTYAFDVDTHRWFKPTVSGTVPEGRYDHSACALGMVMYIHAGWGPPPDIYKLDTTTMVWSFIDIRDNPLSGSHGHSATMIGTKMFVLGGRRLTIRVFDTETNCWLHTAPARPLPARHCCHSAFAYNGELYIFGGWNFQHYLNELWKICPETFSMKKVDPKGKRPSQMYRMCCCMVGDQAIFFGGLKTPDMYVLDLNPGLKTLCKLAVIQYGLQQSELPHNIKWELTAMTTSSN